MNSKQILFLILMVLTSSATNAQMCILDLGSKNSDQIQQVFQLKEAQITALDVFKLQLNKEITVLEAQVKELLETHPQSNPDELLVLAKKHKELEDQMFDITVSYDQKLISLFNEKQYERYVLLCNEAKRTAITQLQE